jgi:hypothetical protein
MKGIIFFSLHNVTHKYFQEPNKRSNQERQDQLGQIRDTCGTCSVRYFVIGSDEADEQLATLL